MASAVKERREFPGLENFLFEAPLYAPFLIPRSTKVFKGTLRNL
jgi:hypothetical protein